MTRLASRSVNEDPPTCASRASIRSFAPDPRSGLGGPAGPPQGVAPVPGGDAAKQRSIEWNSARCGSLSVSRAPGPPSQSGAQTLQTIFPFAAAARLNTGSRSVAES